MQPSAAGRGSNQYQQPGHVPPGTLSGADRREIAEAVSPADVDEQVEGIRSLSDRELSVLRAACSARRSSLGYISGLISRSDGWSEDFEAVDDAADALRVETPTMTPSSWTQVRLGLDALFGAQRGWNPEYGVDRLPDDYLTEIRDLANVLDRYGD